MVRRGPTVKSLLLRLRSFALAGLGSLGANAVIVAVYTGELPQGAQIALLALCFGVLFVWSKLTDDKTEAIDRIMSRHLPGLVDVVHRVDASGVDNIARDWLSNWASERVRREALGDTVQP